MIADDELLAACVAALLPGGNRELATALAAVARECAGASGDDAAAVSDSTLLAVCLAAQPGTEAHRVACRLYRRSVLEWRAARESRQAPQLAAGALRDLVSLCAMTAEEAGWLAEETAGDCGTHAGYNWHRYHKVPVCPACEEGERTYQRRRRRARRRTAKAQGALREAA